MKLKKALKIASIIALIIAIIVLSFILWFVLDSIKDVKSINVNIDTNEISNCVIYDNQENQILNNQKLNNNYTKLTDIKPYTIDAFLSIEDKQFYNHDGINYPRILKALLVNLKDRNFSEGASTITQQLVKNKYLTNEKTIARKIKEIYLTKKLEAREEKDTILESYLNTIYYGNGAYGIGNASYRFFGKKPNELTLSESCVLAGAVNYPSHYSPINNIEKSKERRNLVLSELLKDNKISEMEYKNAINEDIVLNEQEIYSVGNLDLYSRNVLKEASEILKISEQEILNRKYKIYTYQDNKIQDTLNEIISNEKFYEKNEYGNIPDSLSIILDNETGGVCAVAGKSDYDLLDFKRQPGSLIKPVLIYTPALEEKLIYPCSEILDEETNFQNYTPHNVGNKYYGYVSIYDSVAKSLNIPAVKLCETLGIKRCKDYAKKCGLNLDKDDNGLAIALGGLTNGFTLQNITESYLPYTNDGNYKKSKYISKIISPNNLAVYNKNLSESKYCSQESAYLMTEILEYSVINGTSKKLSNLDYEIAGKTGTVNVKNSNKNTDAYSLAYTTAHTMSVWLGNYSMNDKYNLNGSNNGGTYATEIIRSTFEKIYEDKKPKIFDIPNTIVELPIDTISLKENHKILLGKNLPERYKKMEIFSIENLPPDTTKNLDIIESVPFSVISDNNHINVSLDCKEYLNYFIYRIDSSNNTKLLTQVQGKSGQFEYADYDIEFNKKYKYYIVCKSPYNNSSFRSAIKSIVVKKNYETLLNNVDNTSWIFG